MQLLTKKSQGNDNFRNISFEAKHATSVARFAHFAHLFKSKEGKSEAFSEMTKNFSFSRGK